MARPKGTAEKNPIAPKKDAVKKSTGGRPKGTAEDCGTKCPAPKLIVKKKRKLIIKKKKNAVAPFKVNSSLFKISPSDLTKQKKPKKKIIKKKKKLVIQDSKPAEKAKEKEVAMMYGMGRVNAIKLELENLKKDMEKKMKDRIKKIPSLTAKDYKITKVAGGLHFESEFGNQSLKDQKRAQDLQTQWAKLKGLRDEGLQDFMKKYNRSMKSLFIKVQRGEYPLKQKLTEMS